MLGLPEGETKLRMCNRLDKILACGRRTDKQTDRRTDGRTDRHLPRHSPCYVYVSRGKNRKIFIPHLYLVTPLEFRQDV